MAITYSVIIPAYNSEQTICRCLDSLIHQIGDRQDIEIILINDGSKDRTDQICTEYAKLNYIKYISTENRGVSAARNEGIRLVKGKYISFVDSDDYCDDHLFEMLDKYTAVDYDLILMSTSSYKRRKNLQKQFEAIGAEESAVYLSDRLRRQKINAIHAIIFKADIIRRYSISFPHGLHIGEDKVFILEYILHVKSVKTIDYISYHLCLDNRESLSRKRRDDLCDSVLREHLLMHNIVTQTSISESIRKIYLSAVTYSYYRSAYSVIKELKKYDLDHNEKNRKTLEILKRYQEYSDVFRIDKKSAGIAMPIKYRMISLITVGFDLLDLYFLRNE